MAKKISSELYKELLCAFIHVGHAWEERLYTPTENDMFENIYHTLSELLDTIKERVEAQNE